MKNPAIVIALILTAGLAIPPSQPLSVVGFSWGDPPSVTFPFRYPGPDSVVVGSPDDGSDDEDDAIGPGQRGQVIHRHRVVRTQL
jgi:hypothetical protein